MTKRELLQLALDALSPAATAEQQEAAITALEAELAKSEPEPVAYAVLEGRNIEDSAWGYIAAWYDACQHHINEAVGMDIEGAGLWKAIPLYLKEDV